MSLILMCPACGESRYWDGQRCLTCETEKSKQRIKASVAAPEAENVRLWLENAELRAALDEIAADFIEASEERPGAFPGYIGSRWKDMDRNWTLRPKFAAYLREAREKATQEGA